MENSLNLPGDLCKKREFFSGFFKGCLYKFLKQLFDCFYLRQMKNNFAEDYELQVNFCCISQLEVSTGLMYKLSTKSHLESGSIKSQLLGLDPFFLAKYLKLSLFIFILG